MQFQFLSHFLDRIINRLSFFNNFIRHLNSFHSNTFFRYGSSFLSTPKKNCEILVQKTIIFKHTNTHIFDFFVLPNVAKCGVNFLVDGLLLKDLLERMEFSTSSSSLRSILSDFSPPSSLSMSLQFESLSSVALLMSPLLVDEAVENSIFLLNLQTNITTMNYSSFRLFTFSTFSIFSLLFCFDFRPRS